MMEKNVPFLSELAQIRHSYLVFDLNFATQKQGEDQRALLHSISFYKKRVKFRTSAFLIFFQIFDSLCFLFFLD